MAEAVTVGATLRARWPVLVIPSAIYFVSHFHRIALGVVAQDLMRAFTITAATLGALAAIYPYVFVAMALVAGSLADTLGPRRTLGAGALAMGLGALVFGLAPSFSVVVLGRLVVSIGASVILIAFLTLAAERFRTDDFATISGLTQTVGNLGGLAAAGPWPSWSRRSAGARASKRSAPLPLPSPSSPYSEFPNAVIRRRVP